MDCCSPYPEFANRHSIGGLNAPSQESPSPYYNYGSSSANGGIRYPTQGTGPPMYRGGVALPPLTSPALPQPPSNGIDSPMYNEYSNNDRFNNYSHHVPYGFGGSLQTGGYFNGYNREHNSNYNYYHPYEGYNRYSYHHKDTYSSNYNSYSSPYYQRDHNHHHQPPPPSPSPHHHHYPNPFMYNSHGHHAPPTPTYLTDTDGNQTSGSSNSNTPGSLYSEYPQSPVTPYPPSAPPITPSNGGGTPNATGFPNTNKDGKIRKSTGRDKEKSKVNGSRKTTNNSIDLSGMVDSIDRCGTPFHGPSQPPPTYPNDSYTNFPFGMINRMNQPHPNSYMATQPLPSNFLGNQVPWSTSGGTLNRGKKGAFASMTDDQMPPPPPSGAIARTTTPSAGNRNENKTSVAPSSEKAEISKTQSAAIAPKTNRPVKRTRKKTKPNPNTNNCGSTGAKPIPNKNEQTPKDQILSEINKNITPLPGFQQAFGSTEIGRFSEVFFNLSESPIIDQLFVESEADTLSPQPWETGDSLEGPHFNLQIGAYYADNYYNNNGNPNNSGNGNNINSSDSYPNSISSCINIHNNNYNYYQYDSGGSSCSTNSNNYSLYNSNNGNNNFTGNNSNNMNNCYFREIRCSDY